MDTQIVYFFSLSSELLVLEKDGQSEYIIVF